MVRAVARAALPATRVGEPPRLVRPKAVIQRDDLARRLSDSRERSTQLSWRPSCRDAGAAHRLAFLAGLADLGEAELVGGIAAQPAAAEVASGLRVAVGLGLRVQGALDLVVDDHRHRIAAAVGL